MRKPLVLENRDYFPSEQMPVAVADRYPQQVLPNIPTSFARS